MKHITTIAAALAIAISFAAPAGAEKLPWCLDSNFHHVTLFRDSRHRHVSPRMMQPRLVREMSNLFSSSFRI